QPPRQLVADIPPDLERACLKALAKRQEDRYTTAGDFAADLRRVLPTKAGAELTDPQQDWSASPPMSPVERHTVGREKELAELGRAFESAVAGQRLFVCVTGEPGMPARSSADMPRESRPPRGSPRTLRLVSWGSRSSVDQLWSRVAADRRHETCLGDLAKRRLLQTEEMLGAVVERLLKAMRSVRPQTVPCWIARCGDSGYSACSMSTDSV